jgi:Zn-dependent protease with chaperone function
VIEGLLFDGRSARARRVQLAVEDGALVAAPLEAGDAPERWPLAQVQWPERTRHTRRVLHLPGGAQLEAADAAAFDAWRRAHGARESWVVRAQQHWRATLAALVLLGVVLAVGYRWGVPWLADAVVALVPHEVDRAVGRAAFDSLRPRWLEPSKLPPERQAALRAGATQALDAAVPRARQRPWTLHFHAGGKALGANAFALPDGSIVITDELIALLEGHDDAVIGVFGHEYGHVQRRHGMRALARFALVSAATSVALGDFSAVIAGVPALLAQLGYSRDAEREADADAARLLAASGRAPAAMAVLFERLAQRPGGDAGLPIALASHPLHDERMRFFREYRRGGTD